MTFPTHTSVSEDRAEFLPTWMKWAENLLYPTHFLPIAWDTTVILCAQVYYMHCISFVPCPHAQKDLIKRVTLPCPQGIYVYIINYCGPIGFPNCGHMTLVECNYAWSVLMHVHLTCAHGMEVAVFTHIRIANYYIPAGHISVTLLTRLFLSFCVGARGAWRERLCMCILYYP